MGDTDIPRPWSKYASGSSANAKNQKTSKGPSDDANSGDRKKKVDSQVDEIMANDPKLREFLQAMKPRAQKKTWENDDAMWDDDGAVPDMAKYQNDSDDEYQEMPAADEADDADKPDTVENNTAPPMGVGMEMHPARAAAIAAQEKSETDQSKEEDDQKQKERTEAVDKIADSGRLFVRNLCYSIAEKDLEEYFKQYGPISEIHLPMNSETKQCKGFAYVLYMIPEHAVRAFSELDGRIFQGRLLHILPAQDRPGQKQEDEGADSSFKKNRKEQQKESSMNETNWNSLFMSQDAVADAMANKMNVAKSDILDVESDNMAVRLALAETHTIQETIKYLQDAGVSIDAFKANMKKERSDTVIMVKNIPFSTQESELRDLFGRHGDVIRIVLPPTRTVALVEYSTPTECKVGFKSLAYKNFHGRPLLLEKAPVGVFTRSTTLPDTPPPDVKKELTGNEDAEEPPSATLYVKNLNFSTTNDGLASIFNAIKGFRSAKISMKKDVKSGKLLSMGFGFVEFNTVEGAKKALQTLQNVMLDGHSLQLKFSDRTSLKKSSATEKNGKEIKAVSTKLIIRNVPFEATKKDITDLFGTFGQLKRVRLPKKYDGSTHRGFAFVDFLTKQEAKTAFENLHSTHFYGRHLVLEWAQDDDSVDALRAKTKRLYETANGETQSKKSKIEITEGLGGDSDDDSE